jgi:hypothetical protein
MPGPFGVVLPLTNSLATAIPPAAKAIAAKINTIKETGPIVSFYITNIASFN